MKLEQHLTNFYLQSIIGELSLANRCKGGSSISYTTLLYLDIIALTPNCTVSYIANAINVAKPAVTIKIKELVENGLVYKEQSSEDRRIHYLHVNEEFLTDYRRNDYPTDYAVKEIEKRFTEAEISSFCEMLDICSRHFSQLCHGEKN